VEGVVGNCVADNKETNSRNCMEIVCADKKLAYWSWQPTKKFFRFHMS
jgi:hypothetical protein